MPARRARPGIALRQLNALSSPARQEVASAFGDGPATVKELAVRLGRSRQALHYHVDQLVRAGFLRAEGTRGEGRAAETIYGLVSRTLAAPARRTPRELDAAERAAKALLRLTTRELTAAIRAGNTPGPQRKVVAARAKCRLDAEGLAQLNTLLDQLLSSIREVNRPAASPTWALTVVLTPVRDAAPTPPTRKRR